MTSEQERLAVLETKVAAMEKTMSSMDLKVDEMHGVLMQAKGVKWLAWVLIFAGGFLSGSIGKMFHFFVAAK